MSKYVGFVSYTPEAWALMIDHGLDREGAIRDILREAGGTLENAYWMFAPYDLVGVFEIPDEVDAMAVRYAAFRSGHLRLLEFYPVISSEHNAQMQERASELSRIFKDPKHPEAHRHPAGG
jgi:uncharacterized protein with GYD domain